jgi:lambda family phage holin
MNSMPTKDPNNWAVLWAVFIAWLSENWPLIWGGVLTVSLSWARITYNGGTGRRRALECLQVGLFWLGIYNGLPAFGVPIQAAGLIGVVFGLLGIDIIRDMAKRVLDKKTEGL